MIPTIVSFYTEDDFYGKYAKEMMENIQRLNEKSKIKFKYDFKIYEKTETDTWSSVTFKKPEFIRKWLDRYGSIIWLDIDSGLNRLPTKKTDLILNNKYELGGIDRDPNGEVVYDYLWLIRSTPRTKSFFDEVIEEIDKVYRNHESYKVKEGGDHDAMLTILKKYKQLYPNFYRSIGNSNFAFDEGWATAGISGFEPKRHVRLSKPQLISLREKAKSRRQTKQRIIHRERRREILENRRKAQQKRAFEQRKKRQD